jgi:hypothetical protein
MSIELDIYKKNKINEFNKIFNHNLEYLKNILKINVLNVQKSKFNLKQKQQLINILINKYNISFNYLNIELNKNITNITNFKPNSIIIKNNKKALLIGINYIGTDNELNGCINDVNCINARIINNGFKNVNIMTDITDIKPTKTNILNALKNLLINSQEGDLLFLLYSGHGSYTLDINNNELTGYDQVIIPCDLKFILDDELKQIIQTNLKKNVTLFAMFDSCFSGSVLDLKYQYLDSLNYDNYTENNKELETLGNVFMISGCTDCQTSADSVFNNKLNGAMTWALLESLNQNSNFTWRELVKNMRQNLKSLGYSQIPQFSTGKFENIDLKVFI